jgi:electron transfer flavoprotein alpha subunit
MILVFVETAADSATEVSLETVTFARSLAERTGGPVHALVVGALPEKVADELGAYGVAEVHHAVGDAFSAYAGAA